MRAVWWRAVGPPSVLEPGEAPEPVPGPDEVLIRVEAAGITFIETQTRAGRAPKAGAVPPAVLGNGVGGTVAAVGAGGDRALVGQRVVASLNGTGGYAELAVAATRNVVPVPDGVSTLDATALLADGRTALGLHELAAPQAGETVLVEAAAGGLGSLLVQLAQAAGAPSSAPRPASEAAVDPRPRRRAVDYTVPGWTDPVKGSTSCTTGSAAPSAAKPSPRLRPVAGSCPRGGGRPFTKPAIRRDRLRFPGADAVGQRHRSWRRRRCGLAAEGRLRPVIGQTYPLERAADAHAAIESRQTLGKTLLII